MALKARVTYHGISENTGHTSGPEVVYVERDGRRYPLPHYVRHSPNGFSWGYAGSGPAELARCILADYLSLKPLGVQRGFYGRDDIPEIDSVYQKFKSSVIATLRQGQAWSIGAGVIDAFLEEHPPSTVCPKHREVLDPNDASDFCISCEDEKDLAG
jgi:hypothetical protein